jgi:hypothetical protein
MRYVLLSLLLDLACLYQRHIDNLQRIPDNFYTRAADDPYEVNDFAVDLAYFIADHPLTGSVGGNTGKTDTFTGVDIA